MTSGPNPTLRRPTSAAGAALVLLLVVLASGVPARAADTYNIDPNHSNMGFTIRHFFSKVPGHFTKFEGSIIYDAADVTKSTVNVSIDTASIDTNVADRDKHLRSADFFDAEKFPKITFASTKVKSVSATKLQVEGTLTMKGVAKPVTLDVDVLGMGPDAWGGYRSGFEAHTKVNRMDYGVSWNKALEGGGTLLGDDVDIVLNVEAVKPKPAEPPAKK
jgi:polyisoprenoid-binding protein YceI